MTKITESVDLDRRGHVAVLTVNNPPVNALSRHVRQGLHDGLKQAAADAGVHAVVITCAGRTFIAGADITEFGKPPAEPSLHAVLDLIEGCPKPVVAAIHGTALGGGLEVALACHYRVGVKAARFGLPEVKLGLLPGAGGTQRLPRVVGAPKALQMIVSGDPIGADEALAHGLIDEILEGDLAAAGVAFADKVLREKRPLRKIRDLGDKIATARGKPEIFAEFRKSVARQTRGFRAPENCIKAVEAAVTLPFDEGLKRERELFLELLDSPESKAQRYFFFAEREAAKIPDVPADTPAREIRKAAVIGAGTMGGGIAMNFANAGIPVTVVEVAPDALDRGLGIVRRNYEATASRGRITPADVQKRMALIQGTTDWNAVADADIVIEAVFEEMPIKKEVFAKLDAIAKPDAVLATNTSTLDVNEIASATRRPESVIGTHFFSPANVMRLLENVRGARSSKTTVATAMAVGRRIGKVPVLVGVCYGFVGNRMLHQRGLQAEKLILEGALPHQVDKVLTDFGFPMGPFAMGDLHHRGGGRAVHRAPAHRGRGDPGAAALPDGQRGRQDPRGEDRHPGERHRRHLGVRLRLARLPRRSHVLGRCHRPPGPARPDARVQETDGRRLLDARPAPGPARRRRQGFPRGLIPWRRQPESSARERPPSSTRAWRNGSSPATRSAPASCCTGS